MEIPLAKSEGAPDHAAARLSRSGRDFLCTFLAMATPCEVRVETDDASVAQRVADVVEAEARRIEAKFSRYRNDSMVGRINTADGHAVAVDSETGHLLNFAAQCFALSDGLFDITSGVLRRAWRFDGSDNVPAPAQIEPLRKFVGWKKALWRPPYFTLPVGMEIDFGGLAKEYAVDRALAAASALTPLPILVNFGGDLAVSGPRANGQRWNVAIASIESEDAMAGMLELAKGALATSGDARRYLLRDGVRYGHILNPRTGRPMENTPRSVTVAAPSCVEAGMIATLAMLHGKRAEAFLKREGVRAWCIR
jgi:thiamine biosynthesis lipoprotein